MQKPTKNPSMIIKWGVLGTVAYVVVATAYLVVMHEHVLRMTVHDAADSLAGFIAPLAFLWLVLGFFQQGQQLQHSADTLELQSAELSHSVEQQRELVSVTREQLAADEVRRADDLRVARATTANLRPWVQVHSVDVDRLALFYDHEKAHISGRASLTLALENVGKTPALAISLQCLLVLIKRPGPYMEDEIGNAFAAALSQRKPRLIMSVLWPGQKVEYPRLFSLRPDVPHTLSVTATTSLAPSATKGERFYPFLFIFCEYRLADGSVALTTRTFTLNTPSTWEAHQEWKNNNPYEVDNIDGERIVAIELYHRLGDDIVS